MLSQKLRFFPSQKQEGRCFAEAALRTNEPGNRSGVPAVTKGQLGRHRTSIGQHVTMFYFHFLWVLGGSWEQGAACVPRARNHFGKGDFFVAQDPDSKAGRPSMTKGPLTEKMGQKWRKTTKQQKSTNLRQGPADSDFPDFPPHQPT